MTPESIVDVVLTSLITAGLVAMLWTRLNRLEAAVDDLRRDVASIRETDIAGIRAEMAGIREADIGGIREEMARRSDVDKNREEMAGIREDMAGIRDEMARRSDVDKVREEMAVMRSDLTHVALAVRANRPKPMEG